MKAVSVSKRGSPSRLNPTLLVFAGEALALPTGLITLVFLSRMFGAERYGVYSLAAVVIGWVQMVLVSLMARPAQAFVSRAEHRGQVGADVVMLHLLMGAAGAIFVILFAVPLAHILRLPALAPYLTLSAFDVVLFTTGQGYRSVALATNRFKLRAAMGAVRWISRLALILILVGPAGLGVTGAILAAIGASMLELAVVMSRLRLPSARFKLTRLKGFWRTAAPVSASSLGLRLFEKVDLLIVQALAGPIAAGLYGAAQNVTIVAGIFGSSYGAILVSQASEFRADAARLAAAAHDALKVCFRLAPAAALGAACAPQLAGMAFGREFAAAGPLLSLLTGGALGMIWLGVATALLTGAGYGRLVLAVTAPVLPTALIGHFALIPLIGPAGAAACTCAVAAASALAGWVAVRRALRCAIPIASGLRNLLACLLIGVAAVCAPRVGVNPLVWDCLMVGATAVVLVAIGEITKAELRHWLGGLAARKRSHP